MQFEYMNISPQMVCVCVGGGGGGVPVLGCGIGMLSTVRWLETL